MGKLRTCGLSWCDRETVAYDIPLCESHWHAVPKDVRRSYCNPPWMKDKEFIAWCEANLTRPRT